MAKGFHVVRKLNDKGELSRNGVAYPNDPNSKVKGFPLFNLSDAQIAAMHQPSAVFAPTKGSPMEIVYLPPTVGFDKGSAKVRGRDGYIPSAAGLAKACNELLGPKGEDGNRPFKDFRALSKNKTAMAALQADPEKAKFLPPVTTAKEARAAVKAAMKAAAERNEARKAIDAPEAPAAEAEATAETDAPDV